MLIIIPLLVLIIIQRTDSSDEYRKYSNYYEEKGKFKKLYLKYNDIFPNIIDEAEIKRFEAIKHIGLLDDSYVGYLVLKYSPDEYFYEKNRLKNINSIDNYYIYGIQSFNKELCALYTDSYNGLIYALADDQSLEISYVDIQFHNYFCDIDYTKIIDYDDLPYGFDALYGNQTRINFEKQSNFFRINKYEK